MRWRRKRLPGVVHGCEEDVSDDEGERKGKNVVRAQARRRASCKKASPPLPPRLARTSSSIPLNHKNKSNIIPFTSLSSKERHKNISQNAICFAQTLPRSMPEARASSMSFHIILLLPPRDKFPRSSPRLHSILSAILTSNTTFCTTRPCLTRILLQGNR